VGEPLSRHQWLHNSAAAVAQADAVLVVFDSGDQAEGQCIFNDTLTAVNALESGVFSRQCIHLAIETNH
jgi:hypothetical protein